VQSSVASGRRGRGEADDGRLGLFYEGLDSGQHLLTFLALLKGQYIVLALVGLNNNNRSSIGIVSHLVRDGAREREPVRSNRLDDRLNLGQIASPFWTQGEDHRVMLLVTGEANVIRRRAGSRRR